MVDSDRSIARDYGGDAEMLCPEGCGTVLSTNEAGYQMQIPGGLRFVDVPCRACKAWYTVDVFEKPIEQEPGTHTNEDGMVNIEPALSADKWNRKAKIVGDLGSTQVGVRVDPAVSADPATLTIDRVHPVEGNEEIEIPAPLLPALIALANDALPDSDPGKITRGWVDELRKEAGELECAHDNDGPGYLDLDLYERFTLLNTIADGLERYLPPSP